MANKMWAGRTSGNTDKIADDFNSSIHFDCRMYKSDIRGSMEHAAMLCRSGILTEGELSAITEGLGSILEDIDAGVLDFDPDAEDIHMFIEATLTERIGEVGKKLHTARSRNDQVALDLRLYMRDECAEIVELLRTLVATVNELAKKNTETIMPGYTHLQRAQPITFAHHLMAYAMMFLRDISRIEDAVARRPRLCVKGCRLCGNNHEFH